MSVQKFFNHRRVAAVDMTAVVLSLALNLLVPVVHCKKFFYNDMELTMPDFRDIDFIVIGNGFAGHVVANRLSENPDWKVLLLELSHDNEVEKLSQISYIQLKGNTGLAFKNSTYYWPFAYATQPQRYIHGTPEDYNNWENQGNLDWWWDDVVPYFEKSVSQNETELYSSGYVMLKESEMSPAENYVKEMLLEAATYLVPIQKDTYPHIRDTSRPKYRPIVAPYMVAKKDKIRHNLYNMKGAEMAGIHFDSTGKRVNNVTVLIQDGAVEMNIKVHKEVVLSAGAIDSAKLLMLSGVGREEHLKSLNIPVRHKLPVGDNLQDHLIVPLFLEMRSSKESPHRHDSLLDYMSGKSTGYNASESIGELNINIFFDVSNDHRSFIPDFEYRYFYIKSQEFKKLRNWAEFFRLDEKYLRNLEKIIKEKDLLIVGTVVTHPKSVGTVRLRSADYRDMPMITPNYLDDFRDLFLARDAIDYVMNMEKSPDFKKKNVKLAHIPIEECDSYVFKTDGYWLCYMKYFSISQLDHVGTLKMGTPFTSSCVNSRLRVHGISNLRVADASVIPSIPSSEVSATSIMIAEKVAHYIKKDYRLSGKEFVRM